MNLGSDILKSVVFLREGTGNPQSQGTGFFVRTNDDRTFLVTCRHVARHLHERPFVLRANTLGGQAREVQIDKISWHCHPDLTVDVAVAAYTWPDDLDCTAFPLKNCLTSTMRRDRSIGEGNLAQVVGLFSFFEGTRRSSPVVHTGNIALLPDNDPVPICDPIYGWIEVDAYLIETQAMPGASGSPVFVRKPVGALAADTNLIVKPKAYGAIFLLGMYQGSWKALAEDLQEQARANSNRRVPAGMGLAVPGDRIIETIDRSTQGRFSSPS